MQAIAPIAAASSGADSSIGSRVGKEKGETKAQYAGAVTQDAIWEGWRNKGAKIKDEATRYKGIIKINSRSSHSGPSRVAQLKPWRIVSRTVRNSDLSTCPDG